MNQCTPDNRPINMGLCLAAVKDRTAKGQCVKRQCNSPQYDLKNQLCYKCSNMLQSHQNVEYYQPSLLDKFATHKLYAKISTSIDDQDMKTNLINEIFHNSSDYYEIHNLEKLKVFIIRQSKNMIQVMLYHLSKLDMTTDVKRTEILGVLNKATMAFERKITSLDQFFNEIKQNTKEIKKLNLQQLNTSNQDRITIQTLNQNCDELKQNSSKIAKMIEQKYQEIFGNFLKDLYDNKKVPSIIQPVKEVQKIKQVVQDNYQAIKSQFSAMWDEIKVYEKSYFLVTYDSLFDTHRRSLIVLCSLLGQQRCNDIIKWQCTEQSTEHCANDYVKYILDFYNSEQRTQSYSNPIIKNCILTKSYLIILMRFETELFRRTHHALFSKSLQILQKIINQERINSRR
jgi:DNA-binding Xre family transcriptional regulator